MDLRLPPPFPPPASIYTPLLGAPRVSLGLLTQTIRRYFWLPTVIVPSVWAATLFQRWNTQTHTWSRWAENNLCEPHGPPQTTRDPIHTGHTVGLHPQYRVFVWKHTCFHVFTLSDRSTSAPEDGSVWKWSQTHPCSLPVPFSDWSHCLVTASRKKINSRTRSG